MFDLKGAFSQKRQLENSQFNWREHVKTGLLVGVIPMILTIFLGVIGLQYYFHLALGSAIAISTLGEAIWFTIALLISSSVPY